MLLGFISAPSAQAMSLAQALDFSLGHDSEFLAAQKALVASEERMRQARARLGPSLSAELDARRVDTERVDIRTDLTLDQKSYAVTIRQPLLNLALTRGLTQSEQRLEASRAVLAQARQDAVLRLVSAYFDILVAQDSLATVQAEKTAIAEQLAQAQRSFEVGTATITDQQEARARFDLASAREISAQNQLNIARSALSLLTRQPTPETLSGVRSAFPIPAPQPQNMESWVEAARAQNPGVVRARLLAEAARTEIGRRRGADLPSLGLSASHSGSWESTLPTDETRRNVVGVTLTIPLLGGPVPAEVREAVALSEEESFKAQGVLLSAEQAARSAYLSVMAGLAQVRALEAAEQSSQLALASNKLGYEVGVRINIDVLNAQQQVFAAQRDLSKARYDTLLASLRLKAATGSLSTEDIMAISKTIVTGKNP
ncbi:MAG: TolC family outer membrane protein [Burkholderiaceae bacterium]